MGFVTGGSLKRISTIAEFKNGNWKKVGDLAQARMSHGAITLGSTIMVVGGWPEGGTL